jgi:hypothetical protein
MFLFSCTVDCVNNNYHFQIILALATILLIHQCIHFWGASTVNVTLAEEPVGSVIGVADVALGKELDKFSF